ncbi:TPA: AAA family ATPase [Escherichia coli]
MVAENQPGHIDQIKQTNAGAVYRLIDQLGPVSRIDLSRLAQLAPASITKIVREMLEAHLVQELEIKEAGNRGRPAVGLVVETEAWHYLSLRISRGEIFLALRDLSSKLVVEESQELALKDDSPLLDRIISHIDQFFIRHQKKLERLTSIAITLPGIIDTENGIVHRMPFYEDVKEMPLSEWVVQEQLPVLMVVGIQEGCINHALLTAQAIANDGLPLIGWVANRINPGLAHYAEIIDVLGKKLPAPLIGELPYLPRAEQRELGQYIRLAMLRSVLAVDRVTV